MRVMIIAKATPETEVEMTPTPEMMEAFEAMEQFQRELEEAGILDMQGYGLRPSSQGKRVRFDGSKRSVIDGPFTETKELLAGFSIWKVKDMDEAVEWVKKGPNPIFSPSEVEIRPIYEYEDLADFVTP
ncbi:YciI family protein [Fimbriimonas ginsengisoli]|uniref:PhnB protein n=1 Tax=Fimbriimonas ginsengisoli Gsoil 348 TaxID=661478 RepID=A0A068NJ87_FIMGI|nr:YciI family protein [Fimbriimonas ginsengisoli]AIE83668.1 PhnB protein [Fimbriimonas ginsengisoli Gsoil 348]